MTQTTARPATCDRCNAILPTNAHGHPRYWNTLHLDPTTRIPRGLRICAHCRAEQTAAHPAPAPIAQQPTLL